MDGYSITVEWDTTPGMKIAGFELQRRAYTLILNEKQYVTVSDTIVPSIPGYPNSYTIEGLRPGTRHQFRVRAKTAIPGGEGVWQAWKSGCVSKVVAW